MKRLIGIVGVAAGCGGSATMEAKLDTGAPQTAQEKADLLRCDPANKRIVKLDLNKDDKPDVFKLFATKQEGGQNVEYLTCKEVDINFDGRKDVWFYYSDTGARTREEMDLDFDGKIDLVTFRQSDKVVRQELDTDFDGKADIWRHFEAEKIARVERDSDRNGRIDYWEYYEGGALDRIGYDLDGDGKVDRWDRAPPPEVPPSSASGASLPSGGAAAPAGTTAAPAMPTPESAAAPEKAQGDKTEKKKKKK